MTRKDRTIDRLDVIYEAYIDFVLLGGRLRRGAVPATDPFALQKTLQHELGVARAACAEGIEPWLLDRVEYAIVGYLDECALSGAEPVAECWRAGTLEGAMYETGTAGEVFDDRLQEALEEPEKHDAFLLICLLCLHEGYQGELAREPDAAQQIARRMADIQAALRRRVPPREAVVDVSGDVSSREASRGLPLWLAPVLSACVLLVAALVLWTLAGNTVDAFALDLTAAEVGR